LRRLLRQLPWWLAALAVMFGFGEVTSRLDDWIFQDVPFLANPDREHDLILNDTHCLRGRPLGQYKKYKLNEFGFRGPSIAKDKPAGTTRVMILGASETFGLYESEGHEYPEVLRAEFAKTGDKIEVINAAVAGMTLPSLKDYWEHWAKDFHPDIVVIYPSPQFYLDNDPPKAATPRPERERLSGFRSRLIERLIDTAKQSDILKAIRTRYVLWRELAGKDDKWIFNNLPIDRLNRFENDLDALATSVAATGATPVLVSHAFKYRFADRDPAATKDLENFRIFFPRATPATIEAFDSAAGHITEQVAVKHGWPIVRADETLTNRRDLFADPVHFNDGGSQAMADLLAKTLREPLAPAKKRSR
jgi:hypothetical protein